MIVQENVLTVYFIRDSFSLSVLRKKGIDPVLMTVKRINNYANELLINACEKCQDVKIQSAILIYARV